jgi:acetoacetyl-CoA synthetase
MTADPIWTPGADRVRSSRMHQFIESRSAPGLDYRALHRWSVTEPEAFWSATAEFTDLTLSQEPQAIVSRFDRMPGAQWFVGARLNYAENLLRGDPGRSAIVFVNERGDRRELSLGELRREVARTAEALRKLGIGSGDRVAGVLPNTPECVIAALATASLGAIWSSCSPDFGSASLLDRLGQIAPRVLFGVDAYYYAGRKIDCLPALREVAGKLESVEAIILTHYAGDSDQPLWADVRHYDELPSTDREPEFLQLPFDHPLFIMFSSGTTGPPKCIVHGAGGTLLQHLKEHQLHTDIRPGSRVFYYTTAGWMMWNWLLSSLASGATLILYDGAPFHPDPGILWRIAEQERITVFGTSARYLGALAQSDYRPASYSELDALETVLSTGSPLAPASFDYAYGAIKSDLLLASIAGGTDLISCFVLGNPMLPVYRGEIQCRGLGMDVRIFDSGGGEVRSGKGELVCASPFPSMPVAFWNDPDGNAYRAAYFERYPGVWHHGDFAELTAHEGIVMYGRSDATLNPGGVRIGTAEIYRILESIPEIEDSVAVGQQWADDTRVVLFVQLAGELELDQPLRDRIRKVLRAEASPRHVPKLILAVTDIPRTLNGKTSERAVADAIHDREIGNLTALANPASLDNFRNRPELKA